MKKIGMLFLLLGLLSVWGSTPKTFAKEKKPNWNMSIEFQNTDRFVLITENGKKLHVNLSDLSQGRFKGTLKKYRVVPYAGSNRTCLYLLDDNSRFTIICKSKTVHLEVSGNKTFFFLDATHAKKIISTYKNKKHRLKITGSGLSIKYTLDNNSASKYFPFLSGEGGNIEVINSKKGIDVKNLYGLCKFTRDEDSKKEKVTRFVPTKKKVTIRNIAKNPKISGVAFCNEKESDKIESIKVVPCQPRSHYAILFNPVKGADGYLVYRGKYVGRNIQAEYGPNYSFDNLDLSEFTKIGELSGNKSTVYIDLLRRSDAVRKGDVYWYRIIPYKKTTGDNGGTTTYVLP